MTTDYKFHYNRDLEGIPEAVEPGEMTYHEHLIEQDGRHCIADPDDAEDKYDGRKTLEAYFDDGNELTVYLDELEELFYRPDVIKPTPEQQKAGLYRVDRRKDMNGEWIVINGDTLDPVDRWTPEKAIADFLSAEHKEADINAHYRAWGYWD